MVAPIFVMLREHGQIWDTLDAIEAQLRARGCDGPLAASCRALLDQLERHNSKEEPIVYPEADAVLAAEATAELRELLAVGRIPDGWVCAGANGGPRMVEILPGQTPAGERLVPRSPPA